MVFPTGGWEQKDTWKLEREEARRKADAFRRTRKQIAQIEDGDDTRAGRPWFVTRLLRRLWR